MRDHPQKYQIDQNRYERPNDKWVCGALAAGLPCATGPTTSGGCGAICKPIKDGDRYYCAQAAKYGGNCDVGPAEDGQCCSTPPQCVPKKSKNVETGETVWKSTRGVCPRGPLPDGNCCRSLEQCTPVKSVMGRRKTITISTVALSLGLILVMVGIPGEHQPMSPGPLTQTHASLIDNCEACHDDSHVGMLAPLFFRKGGSKDPTLSGLEFSGHQSERCLTCHHEMRSNGLHAHGLSPETLMELTEKQHARLAVAQGNDDFESPFEHSSQLACAECHQEHRGPEFDLMAMSDTQCRNCHVYQFDSFTEEHPPFVEYPYRTRTNINFDHQTHFLEHFANYRRTADTSVLFAEAAIAGDFQATCMNCHEQSSDGVMTTLPFETACATCHDRQITASTEAIEFLAIPEWPVKIESSTDISDFRDELELIDRLSVIDQYRLGFSPLAIKLLETDSEFSMALSQLERFVRSTTTDEDGEANESDEAEEFLQVSSATDTIRDSIQMLGDEFRMATYELRQRRQDSFMRALDRRMNPPTDQDASGDNAGADTDSATNAESDRATQLLDGIAFAERVRKLTDGKISDELIVQMISGLSPVAIDEFFEKVAPSGDASDTSDSSSGQGSMNARFATSEAGWSFEAGVGGVGFGPHRLLFQPQRHSDPFMVSYLEFIAYSTLVPMQPDAPEQSEDDRRLIASAINTYAAGRCFKCHSMGDGMDGAPILAWEATKDNGTTGVRSLNRFSHNPHLTLGKGCSDCHRLNNEEVTDFFSGDYWQASGLPNLDRMQGQCSGFLPLSNDDCARCHAPGKQRDSCMTCHNYHAGN